MQAGCAALWLTHVDAVSAATLDDYRGWLGAGEATRFERFARPARQRQFLIGRGLLREALGELLAVAAASIRLDELAGQAPALVNAGTTGLSISHSGPWVACAVSADVALGLDIEVRDAGRDLAALAAQAFDSQVMAALDALAPAARVDGFYRRWCEQEARYKLGTHAALACIDVPHPELAIVVCGARPLTVDLRTQAAR